MYYNHTTCCFGSGGLVGIAFCEIKVEFCKVELVR